MSKVTITPFSAYNGYQSSLRNMFLSSTVGITLFGFSKTFKRHNLIKIVKYFSITILLLSIIIGIKSALDFNNYLQNTSLDEKIYKNWKSWLYINIIFIIMLSVIIIMIIFSHKKNEI